MITVKHILLFYALPVCRCALITNLPKLSGWSETGLAFGMKSSFYRQMSVMLLLGLAAFFFANPLYGAATFQYQSVNLPSDYFFIGNPTDGGFDSCLQSNGPHNWPLSEERGFGKSSSPP